MFNIKNVPPNVRDYHVFGCPVYILDSKRQSGTLGPPKWEPRSRIGVYLGHSPMHGGSVALVLNRKTGHVSPQYHVVFDDTFSTVQHMRDGSIPSNWNEMCKNASESATDEAYDVADTWFQSINESNKHSEHLISDPFVVVSDQSNGKESSVFEGAGKPNLREACEGENKATADSSNESKATPKAVSVAGDSRS